MSLFHQLKFQIFPSTLTTLPTWLIEDPSSTILPLIIKKRPLLYLRKDNVWLISRHKDCSDILKNSKDFSSSLNKNIYDETMLMEDAPQHATSRKEFNTPFKVNTISNFSHKIKDIAQELTDKLIHQSSFDTLSELAKPYSYACIGNFLGIKPGYEKEAIKLTNNITEKKCNDMIPYLDTNGFLMNYIIKRTDWSEQKKLLNLALFINAGMDTSIYAITNIMYMISRHEFKWEEMFTSPQLIPNFITECLRLEPVVHCVLRVATKEIYIDDAKIQQGDIVKVCIFAANRDPDIFEHPNQFILNRKMQKPLPYGTGIHKCIGMHLANTMLKELLMTLSTQKISVQKVKSIHPKFHISDFVRGVEEMEIKFVYS